MTFPALTAFYGAVLAIIFAALSLWVVAGRVGGDILHGDGGNDTLLRRIRSHGNFAEYVPFALLLIGLLEAHGASHPLVRTLLLLLVVARILHPIGMFAPKNSPQQFVCRGGAVIVTNAIILVAAITLLVRLS